MRVAVFYEAVIQSEECGSAPREAKDPAADADNFKNL